MQSARPQLARSASASAALSFLWPGLGQAVQGRRRAAVLLAAPAVLLALALGRVWFGSGSLDVFAVQLLVPSMALALGVGSLFLGAWRVVAIVDAFVEGLDRYVGRRGRRSRRRVVAGPRAWAVLAVLLLGVVVPHAAIVLSAAALYRAGNDIFVSDPGPDAGPAVSPDPSGVGPMPSPYATPVTSDARINVLLVGSDAGLGYRHSLTDSMILVSVDPQTKTTAMVSIPRDIARFPLYLGGEYRGKINSLATAANADPTTYPDGGLRTLARQVGFLLGIPVHYYVYVNLAEFIHLIDEIGGVDIVNEREIRDASYAFADGQVGFFLGVGPHHLDGRTALAFVRSRKGPGDNDFTRAARQQQLLIALRAQLTSPAGLANLPDAIAALGVTVDTNFPSDKVVEMLQLAKQIPDESIERIVLGPPYAIHPPTSTTDGIYILKIDDTRVEALSVRLFGDDSAFANAIP
jgi:LCP family protein required for cell wall assembly